MVPFPASLLANPHCGLFELGLLGHPIAKPFLNEVLAGLVAREDFF